MRQEELFKEPERAGKPQKESSRGRPGNFLKHLTLRDAHVTIRLPAQHQPFSTPEKGRREAPNKDRSAAVIKLKEEA